MVRVVLKRVGILKGASVLGILGFFSGILFGFVALIVKKAIEAYFSVFSPLAGGFSQTSSSSLNLLTYFVYTPLSSAVLFFIGGFICIGIFNLSLKVLKGWELEMQEVEEPSDSSENQKAKSEPVQTQ